MVKGDFYRDMINVFNKGLEINFKFGYKNLNPEDVIKKLEIGRGRGQDTQKILVKFQSMLNKVNSINGNLKTSENQLWSELLAFLVIELNNQCFKQRGGGGKSSQAAKMRAMTMGKKSEDIEIAKKEEEDFQFRKLSKQKEHDEKKKMEKEKEKKKLHKIGLDIRHAQRVQFDSNHQMKMDALNRRHTLNKQNVLNRRKKITHPSPNKTSHMHQAGIRAPEGTQHMQGGPGDTEFDRIIRPPPPYLSPYKTSSKGKKKIRSLNLVDHSSLTSMQKRDKGRRGGRKRIGGSKTHTRKRKRRSKLRDKTLKN